MLTQLNEINTKILSLSIDSKEQEILLNAVEKLKNDYEKLNYKLIRYDKDKKISVNLLEASLNDINKQYAVISEKNALLESQKERIEYQNENLLNHQVKLKSIMEKLRENLNDLEHSYNELEEFSHIASHDLKTPLRAITSFSQLLHRKYAPVLGDEGKNYIDYIVNGTTKLNAIVDDLVKYSNVGRDSKNLHAVPLDKIIEGAIFELKGDIKATTAKVIIENLPNVLADSAALNQLFKNLIENAIKFRKQNEVPEIIIQSKELENYWQISVSDNGIGMPEQYKDKAFKAFQRFDKLDDTSSNGIGLAICRKIVHLHQGKIWYENDNKNKGTTFHFTLKK